MIRVLKPEAKTAELPRPKSGSGPGFEATLWAAADKLRGNMDAAEYKHVALGLIFLKYISDRFEERQAEILAEPDVPIDLARSSRRTATPTPPRASSGCRRTRGGTS